MVSRAALLWHLAVGPSVRPSVVLAQPEPEEEEAVTARRRPSLWFAALYRGRVILASPGALIALARPHEQQATNSVTAAPKVVG